MKSKKKMLLIAVLISLLIAIFFLQKNLVNDFSTNPERIELSFGSDNEILSYVLAEIEYIDEIYTINNEYGRNNQNNVVSIISIEKSISSKDEFFKDRFIDYLRLKNPDLNEELLNITDYSQANTVLMEFHRFTKVFIASLVFILIVVFFIRRIKIINKYFKSDLEIYYLKEIIHLRISEILEESIKLALMVFGGIFLFQWIIKFQFNIPGKYLPVNNIFDFKFYRMTNNMKLAFSNYGNVYDSTLFKIKLLTLGFIVIGLIIFLLLIRIRSNKVLEGRDDHGESII